MVVAKITTEHGKLSYFPYSCLDDEKEHVELDRLQVLQQLRVANVDLQLVHYRISGPGVTAKTG